jgi:UDP-2-acetamido-3-amino-2,3-dideoxy-glucuronate N-acetyltransferase
MTSQSSAHIASARIAVIGCGHWGKNLVRNFAELGALVAIADNNKIVADGLAKTFNCKVLEVDAILADKSIDGVAIAAPAILHAEIANKALLAGKHVFVEKPLALTVADAEGMIATAKAAGKRLMVGHLLQYHTAYIALRKFVESGKLGRLTYIYSNRLSLGKIRREEDVLWSFAPHDISMILGLAGEEPEQVSAVAAPTLHATIGDLCIVNLAFPSGLKGHIFASWLHPVKEQKLVVVGERGMAVFEDSITDPMKKLLFYPHQISWVGGVPNPVKGEAEPVPYEVGEPLKAECQHFIDCVTTGQEPRTNGAEGLRVQRVLEQATHSLLQSASAKPAAGSGVVGTHKDVTIHASAYVDDGVTLGAGTKIWHFSHILGSVSIGKGCNIGQNVVIGPKVTIGDNVKIQNNVSVYEGVTLEDGVFCGPSCVFTNVNNPRSEVARKSEYRPTLVKRGASIGANATIVCGHTLGQYAFIAAGAVVTKDVPDFAMMAGVPARRIGWMSHSGAKLDKDLVCPESKRRYRLVKDSAKNGSSAEKLEEII